MRDSIGQLCSEAISVSRVIASPGFIVKWVTLLSLGRQSCRSSTKSRAWLGKEQLIKLLEINNQFSITEQVYILVSISIDIC